MDNSGDWGSESNDDELEKDMSGIIWLILDNEGQFGVRPDANTRASIRKQIESVLVGDPRIVNVYGVYVEYNEPGDTLDVSVELESIYGDQSFSV